MPTGLHVNKGFANFGNINIQAVKSLSEDNNNGNLNVSNAAVVASNQIVSQNGGNISKNATIGLSPTFNQFQNLEITLPPILMQPIQMSVFNVNTLLISPILAQLSPAKLRGLSEQRPEIISLADFGSIYEDAHGSELSDVGRFIKTSMAARRLRFDHIEALIESVQEVEDASKILEDIANNYAEEVSDAQRIVKFMTKIANTIKNIKRSLDIRKSEDFKDEKFAKDIVSSLPYKTFLVEEYQFSENGFANFSNTKILGQFLFDVRNTLKQYSPSLFGSNDTPPPNNINAGVGGFQSNQPSIGDNFFNSNFSLGEAGQQTVERSADRDFGTYNTSQIDITDGQFNFQVRLFSNVAFSLVGTPFNQFIDILPGNYTDRAALLLTTLSKELRISSGLGKEGIQNTLIETFNGNETGDPFEFIIGSPGDTIADIPTGENSLCSLLRYVNANGDVVLPFESVYVKGDDGRVYSPGSKELADSILQSEEPYDIRKLKDFQRKLSGISSDAMSLISKLLDIGKKKPRLKPIDLFNDIARDFIEAVDLLISDLPNEAIALPGSWGEASIIKLAFSDREIKQLLFQYVLTLGLIGKPSEAQFGDNSVEPFFRSMAREELRNWGDLPAISQDRDLNSGTATILGNVFESLGIESQVAGAVEAGIEISTVPLSKVPTTNSVAGYTVLAFIAQRILNKLKEKGDQNATPGTASVFNSEILGQLISTRHLVFLNRIADFISTITNRADNFLFDGKSRLNRLNHTTVSAFAFEAFLSFLEPLLVGISEPNAGSEYVDIVFNTQTLRDSQRLAVLLLGNYKAYRDSGVLGGLNPQQQITLFAAHQQAALASSTGSMKFKLEREETILSQIITRLRRTFELVDAVTTDAVSFLNPEGPNAEKLMELIDVQGGKERVAMINEAQFVLARKALRDFNAGEGLSLISKNIITYRSIGKPNRGKKYAVRTNGKAWYPFFLAKRVRIKRLDIPVFVDGSVISSNERRLLNIVLEKPKFRGRRADNLKILTVGIPAGFSNYLSTEIGITEDNINQVLDKERDVVSVNVYRRSIDFEDIVFKPRSYIFELSRFVVKADLAKQEITTDKFREFLNDKSIEFMRDYSDRPRGDRQDQESFYENEEYSFLSKDQKKELVVNHIESFVLGIYLQLLTGVSTDENDYLVDESLLEGFVDDEDKERFNELILTYIRGLTRYPLTIEQLKNSSPQIKKLLSKIETFSLNSSITEQIAPINLPGTAIPLEQRIELTEDLINFVKLFTPKSLLTGGKIQALRITSPKLFERIFNLAVDPDDFEIDLDKTLATTSGRRMYAVLERSGLLDGPDKIRQRRKNRVISLDQFFVNISTVGDSN